MLETLGKVSRHYRWLRDEGLAKLVEEDRLDPRERLSTALAKARWRRENGVPAGASRAVYVVGLQRSGTNMLVRGIERAPEVEVHNENDRTVFDAYLLRSDATVTAIVGRSRHTHVLFKPLCDSHRTATLLGLDPSGRAHALWVYRGVDARVRSSTAKFGSANVDALAEIVRCGGTGRWERGGLSDDDVQLLRELDVAGLSAESGSALFWYLRNKLFFAQQLDTRFDVTLVSYDRFVAAPAAVMASLCDRLDLRYRSELVAGVDADRTPPRPALELDARVRRLCSAMQERLDETSAATFGAP